MFARSTFRLTQLKLVVSAGFHRTIFRQQITGRSQFQRNQLLKPLTLFTIRQKSSTLAEKISTMRFVWNKIFGKYLLATNIVSSGLLMAVGDLIAQEIRNRRCSPDKREYDWHRLGRMFIVGALQGPLHHYVYHWMDKAMPAQSLKNITRKILIDQCVMSPILILGFFYSACFLENKSLEETNIEILEKFIYIYLMDWTVFPAVQYVNFRYLDIKYRVMYVNIMIALFNVFMSFMKHEFDAENK